MTRQQLSDFAKTQSGSTLATAGGRSTFKVEVLKTRLEFIIRTGNRRQEPFGYVENFCREFLNIGSLRPGHYTDVTRNASYLLGLIKEARKSRRTN